MELNLRRASLKIANLKVILEALATRLFVSNLQQEPIEAEQLRKLHQLEVHLRFLEDAQAFLMISSHINKAVNQDCNQSFQHLVLKLIEDAEVIFETVAIKYSTMQE